MAQKIRRTLHRKHKLEKRVDANIKLIEQLISMGVPKKQIIVTGHSVAGL